jgi:hypothetical protein
MNVDDAALRLYLARPPRATAEDFMRDAVLFVDPGAVQIVDFGLRVRVNRRTRRTLTQLTEEFLLRPGGRWVTLFVKQMFSLYRLLLGCCIAQTCFTTSYLGWAFRDHESEADWVSLDGVR